MKRVIKYLYITFCFLLLLVATSCKSTSASKKNTTDKDQTSNAISDEAVNNNVNENLEPENTTEQITEESVPSEEPALVEGMPSATQEEVPIVPIEPAPESVEEATPSVDDSAVEPSTATEDVLDSEQTIDDESIPENTDTITEDSITTEPIEEIESGDNSALKIDAIQEEPAMVTEENTATQTNEAVVTDTPPPSTANSTANNDQVAGSAVEPILPMASAPVSIIPSSDEESTDSSVSSEPSFENAVEVIELDPIEINVVTGEDARIEIEGEDWFPSSSDIDPSLTYKGKDYTVVDKSIFTFSTSTNGQFDLVFNRNTENNLESQKVKIIVGDRVDTISADSNKKEGDVAVSLPPLESVDVATLDNNTLKKYFDQELNNNKLDSAKNLMQVLRTKDNRAKQIPEMLYLLGQKHETDADYKDIDNAFAYYKDAYDNYPISKFSRMSKERMDYLNRFYLKVP